MPPRRRSSDAGKPSVAPRTHSGQYPQYFHIAPNGAREPYLLRAFKQILDPATHLDSHLIETVIGQVRPRGLSGYLESPDARANERPNR